MIIQMYTPDYFKIKKKQVSYLKIYLKIFENIIVKQFEIWKSKEKHRILRKFF